MTLNNRKAPEGLGARPFSLPPWELLRGKGGVSAFRKDEHGVAIHVPDLYSWRPHGWPALSLEHARTVGRPDGVVPPPRRRVREQVRHDGGLL